MDIDSNSLNCINNDPTLKSPTFVSLFNDPLADPDPDSSLFSCKVDSSFYDNNSFLDKFTNTSLPIIASINTQSIQSKHSLIKQLLQETRNTPLHVLALQETWHVKHPELLSIPNYNFTHTHRPTGNGGGVGFYVKADLNFKIIKKYSCFIAKIFECLTIEVSLQNNKKITVTSIYRSPSTNTEHITEFLTQLDSLLHGLSTEYQSSYVCLDSNINTLNITAQHQHFKYMTTIHSNGFIQCIDRATRIQNNSYTLIDHILTNTNTNQINCGTLICDISDHFITFIQTPHKHTHKPPKSHFIRNFSDRNVQNFKQSLGTLNWNEVLSCNDVDSCYDIFWEIFNTLYDLHFPKVRMRFNKNLHKICNFMTKGLLVSRITKLNLHKISIQHPTQFNIHKYKKYRNIFNVLIRASKKQYYETNLNKSRKDPKKNMGTS